MTQEGYLKAIDIRLKVKPVFAQLIHSSAYEGPCRVGDEKTLSPEAERKRGMKLFERFCEEVKRGLASREVEVLEPVYMEWGDDWVIPEEEFKKLEGDLKEVDLFLISHLGGLSQYPAVKIAERYRKPVAMLGQVMNVDMAAYLRARGLEGYAPLDMKDLRYLTSLLRVRKAVRHTRILIATYGGALPVGVVSSIWDLEGVRAKFGLDYRCISPEEIFEEMDRVLRNESYRIKVEERTDELISNAERVHMEREYVLRSVGFYIAVKNLMRRYRCDAFVMPCFEICAKRIPAEKRVTFCLAHSLLKDEGYPSACEGDISVLLAMMLLMYISRKSAYMGNSYIVDEEENVMALHHDVPGLKMKGIDGPDLPYEIRNFTLGGWGATIRYDFSRDKGEVVTLARFDPTATRLLITRGKIVGCGGFDEIGCSLRALIKIPNVRKLFHEEADFGHHLAMVYGDYIQELKDLGRLMRFDILEV